MDGAEEVFIALNRGTLSSKQTPGKRSRLLTISEEVEYRIAFYANEKGCPNGQP
jgi:hypothetical protein